MQRKLNILEKEIKKFFAPNLVELNNNPRIIIKKNTQETIITILEKASEATCKELKISLPKNMEWLSFKIEDFDKCYKIVRKCYSDVGGAICEHALLIRDQKKRKHLLLIEMRSTLRRTREKELKKLKNKFQISLILLLMLLKFFDYEPDFYHIIIGYMAEKTTPPTEFDIQMMKFRLGEKEKKLLQEWKKKYWDFTGPWNLPVQIRKYETECTKIVKWRDISINA